MRRQIRRASSPALCALLLTCCSALYAQPVRAGDEVFIGKHLSLVVHQKVGIVCNHTSVLPNRTTLVDTLLSLGIHVTALFSPEHGIGEYKPAGQEVENGADTKTGLHVYSLYGMTRKPTPDMMNDVDVLLFDLQDVGARFYTYASTMANAMEAAAENGKRFIVLDRPNPIDGKDVEGPVLDTTLRSFVGMFPIAIRHGMTLGELAKMIVGEKWVHESSRLDLAVIPMEGWQRKMWFDETGLPWIPPSPNMKTLSTAIVYPGTCLFEGTNVSEGRGTDHPFEYIGAPWIDGDSLAKTLNDSRLRGVHFEPVHFTPVADSIAAPNPKYEGQYCGGVYLRVSDRSRYHPVEGALTALEVIHQLYPSRFLLRKEGFDRLAGQRSVGESLGKTVSRPTTLFIRDSNLRIFEKLRSQYLLY